MGKVIVTQYGPAKECPRCKQVKYLKGGYGRRQNGQWNYLCKPCWTDYCRQGVALPRSAATRKTYRRRYWRKLAVRRAGQRRWARWFRRNYKYNRLRNREYYRLNKQEVLAAQHRYRELNKEARNARKRELYAQNREQILARIRYNRRKAREKIFSSGSSPDILNSTEYVGNAIEYSSP